MRTNRQSFYLHRHAPSRPGQTRGTADHRSGARLSPRTRLGVWLALASLLVSCGTSTPGAPAPSSAEPAPSNAAVLTGGQIDLSQEALQSPVSEADLARLEAEAWAQLRTPLREPLGAQADELHARLDTVRLALLNQVAMQLQGEQQSHRPPGLAQFTAFGSVLGMMPTIGTTMMKWQEGTYEKTDKLSEGNASGQVKIKSTRSGSRLTMEIDIQITAAGENGTQANESAKGKLEANFCPDGDGHVPYTLVITMNSGAAVNVGAYGVQIDLAMNAYGVVDDNANLVRLEADTTTGFATQTQVRGQTTNSFSEVQTVISVANPTSASVEMTGGTWSQLRTSTGATPESVDNAVKLSVNMSMLFGEFFLGAAQQLWKNGYCVEILVDEAQDSNQVEPGATRPFTARVRHKFEGVELNVPVQAELSGEKSLTPLEGTPAPVAYTYVASDKEYEIATAKLETLSKRGRATKDLTFTTVPLGWKIDQTVSVGGFSYHYTGLSCGSKDGTWIISYQGKIPGGEFTGTIQVFFGPDGKGEADWVQQFRVTGLPGGSDQTGSGEATIAPQGDAYLLTFGPVEMKSTGFALGQTSTAMVIEGGDTQLTAVKASPGECPRG